MTDSNTGPIGKSNRISDWSSSANDHSSDNPLKKLLKAAQKLDKALFSELNQYLTEAHDPSKPSPLSTVNQNSQKLNETFCVFCKMLEAITSEADTINHPEIQSSLSPVKQHLAEAKGFVAILEATHLINPEQQQATDDLIDAIDNLAEAIEHFIHTVKKLIKQFKQIIKELTALLALLHGGQTKLETVRELVQEKGSGLSALTELLLIMLNRKKTSDQLLQTLRKENEKLAIEFDELESDKIALIEKIGNLILEAHSEKGNHPFIDKTEHKISRLQDQVESITHRQSALFKDQL